eukprot:16157-Heterococcus_DN1.PRE.1
MSNYTTLHYPKGLLVAIKLNWNSPPAALMHSVFDAMQLLPYSARVHSVQPRHKSDTPVTHNY